MVSRRSARDGTTLGRAVRESRPKKSEVDAASGLVSPVRTPLNTSHAIVRGQGKLMCRNVLGLAALVAFAAIPRAAAGQSGGTNGVRSTSSGVYTAEQASRGRDMYAMQCKSCHTPASHTGVIFANSWDRRPLSDLYQYIVTRMPKNEPGSLQPDEYVDVLAYLLKLNDLPTGPDALPADSVAMKKIRIEVGKKDP